MSTLPPSAHGAADSAASPAPLTHGMAVPDDAPAIFRTRLGWAYPAYRAYSLWSAADGLRMSAAMSFYGLLSLAPLLLLIVVALGWWLGQDTVQATLIAQVSELIGPQGASMLEGAISSTRAQSNGVFASIVALVTLVMGATGVFAELQSALERLWVQGSNAAPDGQWWRKATVRLRGVAYVMAFGFLLLVSLVISSVLSYVQSWAGGHANTNTLLAVLNVLVSLAISTALFLGLMRMSSGPQPGLRHLAVGALIGAVLFALGKQALAVYLRDAAVVSAYGAAGSLVVILFWIYFTSAVLLFAASCARVSAELQGDYSKRHDPVTAAAVTAAQAAVGAADGTPASAHAARGSSAAVANALADVAQPWQDAQGTPKALNWAALLLAFSAGHALVNSRRTLRNQTRLNDASAQLSQVQHAMAQLNRAPRTANPPPAPNGFARAQRVVRWLIRQL